jgi:hypothetical protein
MEDQLIIEIRKIKDALAAKFNYDLRAMLKNAMQKQKESERRLVNLSKKKIFSEAGKGNEGITVTG